MCVYGYERACMNACMWIRKSFVIFNVSYFEEGQCWLSNKWFWPIPEAILSCIFYLNLGWTFKYVWVCGKEKGSLYLLCCCCCFFFTHMLIPITSMWRVKFGICEHLRVNMYILFIFLSDKKGPKVKWRTETVKHKLNGK